MNKALLFDYDEVVANTEIYYINNSVYMKKLSRILSLALVSAVLFAGCAKNSDLEALSGRVDSLESDKIKSIEALVSSIQTSVSSLEGTDASLQNYVMQLQKQVADLETADGTKANEISELQNSIETLQAKDSELQSQITGLKEYADKLLSDSQTWANATFATLEQYNASAKTISEIQKTLTEIDGKITATDKTVDAHTSLLSSIQSSISAMQLDIDTLKTQMSSVLSRVQSIIYVPKYSDGDALVPYTDNGKITPGLTELDFRVKPDSLAEKIATLWTADKSILSLTAYNTVTKSAPQAIDLSITNVVGEDGYLTVTASGKGLKDEFFIGIRTAAVCLSLSDDNNNLTTSYIRLSPWRITVSSISFADDNFKNYCLQHFDTDSDGKLSDFEAFGVTDIDCSNLAITSLQGIEYFKNLGTLNCSDNSFESLDVTPLKSLTSLNVSGNDALTNLTINGTAISSLKVSKALPCLVGQYVYCYGVLGVVFSAGSSSVTILSGIETTANFAEGRSWATKLGSGWGFASSGDFQTIYPKKSTLNTALTSIGATSLSGIYWTNYDYMLHYCYDMDAGYSKSADGSAIYKIRATRNL